MIGQTDVSRRSFLGTLAGGVASLALAACGGSENLSDVPAVADSGGEAADTEVVADTQTAAETSAAAAAGGKAAIVVFSWSGNTRSMAERISGLTGAAVWELTPETPYPEIYDECTDEALAEQREGTLRPYVGDIDGWNDIDVVFLGYPIWWMDLTQITKAFVANHDWSDKTVVPFCSYQSSGWSGTPESLAETCEGATLVEGIGFRQADLPGALDEIDGWYDSLGLV